VFNSDETPAQKFLNHAQIRREGATAHRHVRAIRGMSGRRLSGH
jgi:hypothetical protein